MMAYEKLYDLHNVSDKTDFEGISVKYECTINGERGLFKERMSMQSKDHVMEQVIYELSKVLGVNCCKAYCRKTKDIYGSFSKFEVNDIENLIPFSKIAGKDEMYADELLDFTIKLTNGNINNFVVRLYQYIIFDYITGQMDRHLDNLSVYRRKDGIKIWYPLYDNGLCCFASYANDASIESLKNRHYSSRMGSSKDILDAIIEFRYKIYSNDLNNLIHYKNLTKQLIYDIIDKADKYNQIGESRRKAIAVFIYQQALDIHNVNYRRIGGI